MSSKVGDLMTRRVFAATENAEFTEIARALRYYGVSAMPVVNDDHRVIGVVSSADLLNKVAEPEAEEGHLLEDPRRASERRKSGAYTARELMTEPAVTIGPYATVQEAAELMRDKRVKRLPVADEAGRLVGVISRVDVLRAYTVSDAWIRTEVGRELAELSLGEVEVSVHRGSVTLIGHVPRRSDIPRLLHAVRHCQGVARVESGLSYDHDDLPSLSAAYAH